MADKKIEMVWESGTHWHILVPVEGYNLPLSIDKMNFTISIPNIEAMNVESIVKIIVQAYRENKDNPVIQEFLKFLQQPENKEELQSLQKMYRLFHNSH
jgi:hypothetical protein